jgi:peptidoglycan/xylan/chitin deacetylase (PgdA/CDA1 family)
MLLQAKSFLQLLIQKLDSIPRFSIIILGNRDDFGAVCETMLTKLQRDVSRLSKGSTIHFVDFASSGENLLAEVVSRAVGIFLSPRIDRKLFSVNDIWSLSRDNQIPVRTDSSDRGNTQSEDPASEISLCRSLGTKKRSVKIALSFDFDALSAFLGTGDHPDNNMADYSTGIFAGQVGGRRLLRVLRKHGIADQVTWFIPGHTMETFESTVKEIVQSGAEIGLHGYAHEGAYQMTEEQEREVLVKCMEVAQRLTGKKVQGYRAPMYQLRETTIELLKEFGFLYDSSLSHHDSQPYFVPCAPPVQRIDFSKPASSWLRPTELADMESLMAGKPLVEIPTGWNNEDMMALQYFPHLHNSHGHVDARVVEQRWKDIFLWLWENPDLEDGSFVFPLLMHPDTSGMAHVAGMVDRFIGWLRGWGDTVQFHTFSSIAQSWLDEKMKRQD